MRRDDEARQLFVGIVGQRKHDPGRLSAGFKRAHLDAPNNTVGAGRGGDLDPIALRAVAFDRPGQVDCVRIGRHSDRLNRERGRADRKKEPEKEPKARHRRQRCATTPVADRADAEAQVSNSAGVL